MIFFILLLGKLRCIAGDFNVDGKTELAIWRNGVFCVIRSKENHSDAVQFGAGSDMPVASAFNP